MKYENLRENLDRINRIKFLNIKFLPFKRL